MSNIVRAFILPYGVTGKHDGCRKDVPLRRFESGYGNDFFAAKPQSTVKTKTYDYEREIFEMDEPEQYDVLGYGW